MEQEKKIYTVKIMKKVKKSIKKMPLDIQDRFTLLVEDIKKKGALRTEWQNFSGLGKINIIAICLITGLRAGLGKKELF